MKPSRLRVVPLGLSVVALLALAGCGSTASSGPVTSLSPSGSPADGGSGSTSLTVTVVEKQGSTPQSWTLTCDPAGGTHPDPAAACAALAATPHPFAPIPADMGCTQIYGGDQTATVSGTYQGKAVDASFNRTDGCQIARWDALVPVLVIPGGV